MFIKRAFPTGEILVVPIGMITEAFRVIPTSDTPFRRPLLDFLGMQIY
jgi:hypothetical protein